LTQMHEQTKRMELHLQKKYYSFPKQVFFQTTANLAQFKTIAMLITHVHCAQGHNEVRGRPGQDASLAPPNVEPEDAEVFRKQMCCIEESTCAIPGIFQRLPQ